ncbi:MAG: hypothetical protein JEZ08_21440 [Clostridiales bacterium]|nr:hypothetical protein [Clostridiales bacterium]
MNTRLSKLMRRVIILNVVITLIAFAIHGYYLYRVFESNDQIVRVMQDKQVIRETAIRMLEKEGVKLHIGDGVTINFGIFISITTLVLLYIYSQTNGFFAGFFAALCAVLTTYIGGLLLFYVFLSGKSEMNRRNSGYSIKNKWQKYIHENGTLN